MENANDESSWMEGDEREEYNLDIFMGDGCRLIWYSFMRKVITCLVPSSGRANGRWVYPRSLLGMRAWVTFTVLISHKWMCIMTFSHKGIKKKKKIGTWHSYSFTLDDSGTFYRMWEKSAWVWNLLMSFQYRKDFLGEPLPAEERYTVYTVFLPYSLWAQKVLSC